MPLELHCRGAATVPLEVEGVTPAAVAGKSLAQIAALPIYHGNRQATLGEFFDVRGDSDDLQIRWQGPLQGVHWIGAKMDGGEMIVEGSCGRHLGSEMRKGTIRVEGDASDWVGGELHGGRIEVRGNAGHLVGAAYRGSARGMTGGEILIHGSSGNEVGHSMRRGLIAVGSTGDLAGFNMLAGTILVNGDCGIRHGAAMRRGTLIFAGEAPVLLPSFCPACRFRPLFLRLLWRQLAARDFPLAEATRSSAWDLYHGDLIDGGRGEVLLIAP